MRQTPIVFTECGVLCRVTGPDPKTLKTRHRQFYQAEAGRTSLSCSGTLVAPDAGGEESFVLTSGWLLAPFLKENRSEPTSLLQGTRIDVCDDEGEWRAATLIGVYPSRPNSPALRACEIVAENAHLPTIRGIDVCSAALLRLNDKFSKNKSAHHVVLDQDVPAKPLRGDEVLVVSSAFGLVSPSIFRNGVTRGVVSNLVVTSSRLDLILVDARCLSGSEGGPVFDVQTGRLLGLVLPPLTRSDGTSLELGAVIPLSYLKRDCLDTMKSNAGSATISPSPTSSLMKPTASPPIRSPRDAVIKVKQALRSVALVQVYSRGGNGSATTLESWGSGVLVGRKGYQLIVTCAHVVRPVTKLSEDGTKLVQSGDIVVSFCSEDPVVWSARPVRHRASIVFCALENRLDVAVLKLSDPKSFATFHTSSKSAELRDTRQSPLKPGERVFALGHAIFDPNGGLGGQLATVSSGTLASVVYDPVASLFDSKAPSLLQTSAFVFRGHSGGMLCDAEGRLIGLLNSNAKHSDGSIIPEINFAVPLPLVLPLINEDPDKQREAFEVIDKPNEILRALWALEASKEATLPQPQQSEGSGAEFAAFMQRLRHSVL